MPALCRDCATSLTARPPGGVCRACGGRRIVAHPELDSLAIAHLDCDAFYAAVEKRDNRSLRAKPVIVGGGRRGVVSACCYVARISGVRSAMPMFQALKLCPDAVVIRPDMAKYRAVGQQVRALMLATTPLVEPLSIDEAFLDLSGTEAVHGGSPARTLVRLARRIEDEIGVTASVGLSYNKFLAKIASDLDKPRGFAVIGRGDAAAFLAEKPVGIVFGVGPALKRKLEADGVRTLADVRARELRELVRRYGAIGTRLASFARGADDRAVEPDAAPKSISAETTFERDLADRAALEAELWALCETVAGRLKRAGLGAGGIVLKLKSHDFRTLTRSRKLASPTRLADELFRQARPLLAAETTGRRFRLLGVGAAHLMPGKQADPPDLADPGRARRAKVEQAVDAVRARFGRAAIGKGRGWKKD